MATNTIITTRYQPLVTNHVRRKAERRSQRTTRDIQQLLRDLELVSEFFKRVSFAVQVQVVVQVQVQV